MRKIVIGSIGIAAALSVGLGSAATAAPAAPARPEQVAITSKVTFNQGGPNTGTFDATGSSLICAKGTVKDTGYVFGGFQSGRGVQIQVRKDFICEDGTVFVKMQVHAKNDGTERFSWVVQGGTGDYAKLRGSGSGTTTPDLPAVPPTGNTNLFEGFLVG